jgi:hypothetical protein
VNISLCERGSWATKKAWLMGRNEEIESSDD